VVLGSVLLDDSLFPDSLTLDHFSTEAHRRILRAMITLRERGEKIDRVTVASELERRGERESTGGLSYLVSLDDGLPQLPAIDSYLRLLADAAGRRRILWSCQHLSKRAACGSESLEDILASANELFTSTAAAGHLRSTDQLARPAVRAPPLASQRRIRTGEACRSAMAPNNSGETKAAMAVVAYA
jgi:replicative DNA helicase